MQTNLFKARNGKVQGTEKRRDFADKLCLQMQTMGARFADKVCLKMQTNFADKPLQDTPPPNADKRLQKCRRARWGFGQIADELCRQGLSANRAGTPAFLFVYTTLQGLSTAKCRQGLSTAKNADKVCLQLQHVCFFGWFVQFIYSLFHFFGLSSQHHACRFLGIRVFDSAPPFGCGRAGARFLAGFFDFDFFSACPVFAWFLAFCKAEAERQF